MKSISYIGFYDLSQYSSEKRSCSLAATTKMEYISDVLTELGYSVRIVSPSGTRCRQFVWFRGRRSLLNKNTELFLGPTFGSPFAGLRFLSLCMSFLWLTFWMLRNTGRGETVVVYHEPLLAIPIWLVKTILGCHILLEVEEIYFDAKSIGRQRSHLEQFLIQCADGFVLSTELLAERLSSNIQDKECIFCYGSYRTQPRLSTPLIDGLIHVVYAGVVDEVKKGAFNAVEAARSLSSKYVMHIIGFGTVEAMSRIKSLVDSVNSSDGGCPVLLTNAKSGSEYVKFMQKCHIGLSTQSMDGEYLSSSFPSKVLSYLSLIHI